MYYIPTCFNVISSFQFLIKIRSCSADWLNVRKQISYTLQTIWISNMNHIDTTWNQENFLTGRQTLFPMQIGKSQHWNRFKTECFLSAWAAIVFERPVKTIFISVSFIHEVCGVYLLNCMGILFRRKPLGRTTSYFYEKLIMMQWLWNMS